MKTDPLIPKQISHYQLLELLGRGGMGEVWLAQDTVLPRRVAIKLLPPQSDDDPDSIARLEREAQAAASVDHPGVVTIYEAGQVGSRPYIVMQHVEGETLRARIDRGPIPLAEVLPLVHRVADALAEVHALGIVHRDLKPSNIMISRRGAKILDFGVASVLDRPSLTAPGALVGTPATMSPEVLRGQLPDNRSDLWSLGVVFYEMLTGRAPFEGTSSQDLFRQILEGEPAVPSTLATSITPELDFMVMKLLRKDPAYRYSRAEELAVDLASHRTEAGAAGVAESMMTHVPRLAVLSFEVLSAAEEDAYLAAGLTEDLVVDLTRVEGLHVASRAEVAGYSERAVPARTLARELGVDYVLTGSVRRAGNRARINAQLVRASDGHTLWAERFDRTLEDLFDVQAEVSRKIVEALQVALRPGEMEMLDRPPTNVDEAYHLYLRARELLVASPAENLRSEELLRQALQLDPQFALAHATLGECLVTRVMRWWSGLELADEAMACAQQALQLEPGLADAYHVEILVHRVRGESEEATQAIERLLSTNADDLPGRLAAAWSYMASDQADKALPILERLTRECRNEFQAWQQIVNCYQLVGREADAKRAHRHLMDLLAEVVRRDPGAAHPRSLLAASLVQHGEEEAGLAQAERAVALAPDDGRVRYNAACAYAHVGRVEDAIAELRAGVEGLESYQKDWPWRDPDLEALRDHPEFVRMFRPDSEAGNEV